MVVFNCEICTKIFKNPLECTECHNNFCKIHLDDSDECPKCNKKTNYYKNDWLINALEKYEKEEEKKKKQLKKCSLCYFEGEKDSFWVHLIEIHKTEIIDSFTIKNENNIIQSITNKQEQNLYKLESFEIKEFKHFNLISFNEIDNNLNKTFISQNNNLKDKNLRNSSPVITLNKNIYINKKNNNENKIRKFRKNKSQEKRNKCYFYTIHISFEKTIPAKPGEIYYCGRKNKINCDCCPDHICRKKNCICINCMKINIQNFNLKNGELINKSGRIATFEYGEYHCGKIKKNIIINYIGQEFTTYMKCDKTQSSCDDCKILNKFMKYYLPSDIYYRIKNN